MQVGDTEGAFQGLREMEAQGLHPDICTFGAMVHGCAQLGLVRTALRLIDRMHAEGIQPTIQIYTSLIDACVKKGEPDTLQRAFEVRCTLVPAIKNPGLLGEALCSFSRSISAWTSCSTSVAP